MSHQFPPCPASLKAIQHYLKTAAEHDQRDPVISYWCRLYALQLGLKIDRKSDDAKALLTNLMDWLETQKKIMSDNEAITNDVAAQAHIENYALKLFVYADSQDRAENFNKNVVKAFYTAGMLFDVITTFGDLSEELLQNRKYAKWKAAYIHNCLKNGETPIPGPMKEEGEDDDSENFAAGGFGQPDSDSGPSTMGFVHPTPEVPSNFGTPLPPPGANVYVPPTTPNHTPSSFPSYPSGGFVPYNPPSSMATTPSNDGGSMGSYDQYNPTKIKNEGDSGSQSEGGAIVLKPDQITKAQKYCKWAGSALNYDDVPTAIANLQKALKLLQTGQDS